jgi:hypothetical protein
MRKSVVVGGALVLLVVSATPVSAASELHLTGGGTASISQVAFNVSIEAGGAATGSFNCLMAGRSAFVLAGMGLSHQMKVQAEPTSAAVTGTTVNFSGPGFLIMDGAKTEPIVVAVSADAATQTFQLTVMLGAGKAPVAMPVEKMLTGHFELR